MLDEWIEVEGRSLIEDLRWVASIVLVVWPDCGQESERAAGESVTLTGITGAVGVGRVGGLIGVAG